MAIGRKAAELVFNGDSIALDTATSTIEVVKHLQGMTNLTIVTHSLIVRRAADRVLDLDPVPATSGRPVARLSAGSGP